MAQVIDRPKVSIGIPTFNRAQTLRKTIEAVLVQTYSDLELVVCDDASTDETAEVVASYEDRRIRYVRNQTNLGLYQNLNRCIELSRGEYVAIYNDHDDYLSMIVEESVKVLEAHPNVGFVHTALRSKNSHGEIVYTFVEDWPAVMPGRTFAETIVHRWDSPVCGAVAMVRRSLYEKVGYFDALLGADADIDMWIRLALLADVGYVATPLAHIAMRESSASNVSFNWSDLVGHFRLIERNLQRVHGNSPDGYRWHRARYVFERDLKLLEMFCRVITKLEAGQLRKGLEVLTKEGSSWVALAGRVLCRYPRLLGYLLLPPRFVYRVGWKLRISVEQRRASRILARDRFR